MLPQTQSQQSEQIPIQPEYSHGRNKREKYSGYGMQTLERKAPYKTQATSSDVQRFKNQMKKELSDLKREFNEVILNKDKFPDEGKSIEQIAEKVKSGDAEIFRQLNDIKDILLPKGVTTSQLQLPYADVLQTRKNVFATENELFYDKTGYYPSATNLKILGTQLKLFDPTKGPKGTWLYNLNDTKMREIVLLDDFGSFLKDIISAPVNAIGGLVKGVTDVAGHVLPLAKPLAGMLGLGLDTGIDPADRPNLVKMPWAQQFINIPQIEDRARRQVDEYLPGHVRAFETLDKLGSRLFAQDIISSEWLAGWLSPNNYGGCSMPQKQARKVFTASDTKVYQFASDANGEIVLAINPYNIFNPAATNSSFFIQQQVQWVRATGAATSFINTAGSLAAQQGLFASFIMSQFEITTRSILSDLNNSGMTELAYFSDQTQPGTLIIPGNTLSSTSYKTLSNKVEGVIRQWPVFEQMPSSTGGAYQPVDFFFIVITGLPAVTTAFELTISYSVDCTTSANANSASWLAFKYPEIGPATGNLMNALLSQYPWLLFISEQHAADLAAQIRTQEATATTIGGLVANYSEKLRPSYNMTYNQKINADLVE